MMSRRTLIRIAFTIILLWFAFWAPLWITALLGLAGMAYFRSYAESVAVFALSDALHGAAEPRYQGAFFVSLLVAGAVFAVVEFFKNKMNVHARP